MCRRMRSVNNVRFSTHLPPNSFQPTDSMGVVTVGSNVPRFDLDWTYCGALFARGRAVNAGVLSSTSMVRGEVVRKLTNLPNPTRRGKSGFRPLTPLAAVPNCHLVIQNTEKSSELRFLTHAQIARMTIATPPFWRTIADQPSNRLPASVRHPGACYGVSRI